MSVLLVTAHPDDECMFFTPSIRSFIEEGYSIDLLCLSRGNYDGQGEIRAKEVSKSASILGIRETFIVEDEDLQDGPKLFWKPKSIMRHVQEEKYRYILTFDSGGVSGHLNHCSINAAVRNGCSRGRVLELKSLPLLFKYLGPVGGPLYYYLLPHKDILYNRISLREAFNYGYTAMLQHRSQLLWFRHLYLIFSAYMTVNILVRQQSNNKQ